MSIAKEARLLSATMPNAWAMADQLRDYVQHDHALIERPEIVEDMCRPLSAGLYPDCAICRQSIAICPCDPDEAEAALWLQFQQEKTQ